MFIMEIIDGSKLILINWIYNVENVLNVYLGWERTCSHYLSYKCC